MCIVQQGNVSVLKVIKPVVNKLCKPLPAEHTRAVIMVLRCMCSTGYPTLCMCVVIKLSTVYICFVHLEYRARLSVGFPVCMQNDQ